MSETVGTILCLPMEIIGTILHYPQISGEDALNLSSTCTYLRNITSLQYLWKSKTLKWPSLKHLEKRELAWFNEYVHMRHLHKYCEKKIRQMSPTYYWSKVSLSDSHIEDFLVKSTEGNGLGYFYIMVYLRELCMKNINIPDNFPDNGFYNMTNQYYASIIMDYISQHRLKSEWPELVTKRATPEEVAIFFDNWMEPKYDDSAEIFETCISRLVRKVEALLPLNHPLHKIAPSIRKQWSVRLIDENQFDFKTCTHLIAIVGEVLREEELSSQADPVCKTLILNHVISKKQSNKFIMGIFFEALLRRCGVRCDIVYFPNHHFLLWREKWHVKTPSHSVDPFNPEVRLMSKCPFTMGRSNPTRQVEYKYCPSSLLLNLTSLMKDVSEFKKRTFKNAVELLCFLQSNEIENLCLLCDVYLDLRKDTKNVRKRLFDIMRLNPLNNYNMDRATYTLSRLNQNFLDRAESPLFRKRTKVRNSTIKFAVGMVCFHKTYGYTCVIRGWDIVCSATKEWKQNMGVNRLNYGEHQPFYNVLVTDFTERYVAQENLIHVLPPQRLEYIEEKLAVDFSHFNGFFYIPNIQKQDEYPDDGPIREMYRAKMR